MFYPTGNPIKGRSLNTYSDLVKPQHGEIWELYKHNNVEFLLQENSMNVSRLSVNVTMILQVASIICMALRLRQFTQKRNMKFDFKPLQDQHWPIRKRKNADEMNTFEMMDSIIYAIDSEVSDSYEASPRTSKTVKPNPQDDEGRCELILEAFCNEINKADSTTLKKFKKKLGKLYASCLLFIRCNDLTCEIYSRQKFLTKEETLGNITIGRKDDMYPDYRMSIFTSLGYHKNEGDRKLFKQKKDEVFEMIYANQQVVMSVSYSLINGWTVV